MVTCMSQVYSYFQLKCHLKPCFGIVGIGGRGFQGVVGFFIHELFVGVNEREGVD